MCHVRTTTETDDRTSRWALERPLVLPLSGIAFSYILVLRTGAKLPTWKLL